MKQHAGKFADTRSVCVYVAKSEETASGITLYEPFELYDDLDTIVALQESSAEDASFFHAEICFTFRPDFRL